MPLTAAIKLWKGALEPAESSPSGNEIRAWKGATEPAAAVVVVTEEPAAEADTGGNLSWLFVELRAWQAELERQRDRFDEAESEAERERAWAEIMSAQKYIEELDALAESLEIKTRKNFLEPVPILRTMASRSDTYRQVLNEGFTQKVIAANKPRDRRWRRNSMSPGNVLKRLYSRNDLSR